MPISATEWTVSIPKLMTESDALGKKVYRLDATTVDPDMVVSAREANTWVKEGRLEPTELVSLALFAQRQDATAGDLIGARDLLMNKAVPALKQLKNTVRLLGESCQPVFPRHVYADEDRLDEVLTRAMEMIPADHPARVPMDEALCRARNRGYSAEARLSAYTTAVESGRSLLPKKAGLAAGNW